MTDRLRELHLNPKEIGFLTQKGPFVDLCHYRNTVCNDGVSSFEALTPTEIINQTDEEILSNPLETQCPTIIEYLDQLALKHVIENPILFRKKTVKQAKELWEDLPVGYK